MPKGGRAVPLAERWDGTQWKVQTPPAPGGAQTSLLDTVGCPTARLCIAVGDWETKGEAESPLTELWNGTKWKVLATPKPAGQGKAVSSRLTGISCASATRCFAVGHSETNGVFKPLAEVWGGKKWVIQKTQNPARSGGLEAVSCVSATSCMAVGDGIAERGNGTSWSLVKIGKPSGGEALLLGVSCVKSGSCYAVGLNSVGANDGSVAELWNGSAWSVQPVRITTSNTSSALDGVSCTTATNCTAAGSYEDSSFDSRPLAEDFSARWHDVSPPPVTSSGVVGTGLNTVSCAAPGHCIAIGIFDAKNFFESFSESWNGTGWTAQIMPKPKTTSIQGVSCPATNDCEAVGDIATGVNQVPFAERWNGSGWSVQNALAPAGISNGFLLGVSCATKTSCVAVGTVIGKSGKQTTLAEVWNGKAWTITPSPNPAGKQNIELNSVSCPAAGSCLASGTFGNGTFAATWNGKVWRVTSAVPDPKGSIRTSLEDVSCSSATNCMGVGTTFHNSVSVPLAEHWNGAKWSPVPVPTPPGASESGLAGVSCPKANSCGAVGFALRQTGRNAIADSWDGRKWTTRQLETPVGALVTQLGSISCDSVSAVSACMAAGSFNDQSNTEKMLAEQYS